MSEKVTIPTREAKLLSSSVHAFKYEYAAWLEGMLKEAGLGKPTALHELEEKLEKARNQLMSPILAKIVSAITGEITGKQQQVEEVKVDTSLLPYLKMCLLYHRRKMTSEIQAKLANTVDLQMINKFDAETSALDACSGHAWFIETTAARQPRLTDFVTLRYAERLLIQHDGFMGRKRAQAPALEYDNKFGILAPPSAMHPALNYWREQCDLREVGLALAYFDIDNFKAEFNSYTETVVDRNCLPVILRAVEAHCFCHAYGFHIGGDEVVILLPNASKDEAIEFLERLRNRLPTLTFVGVPSQAHISIGLCHVLPDSSLTNSETEQKANDAKQYAKKKGGKNCVVTFKGDKYTEDELEVVRK